MAYDDLLRLSGPASGNSVEASAITVDADGAGGWKRVGAYRQGFVEGRIAGAFTAGGGLAFTVYEATDAAGTGSAIIATGPNLTATHRANLTAAPADGKAAATLSDGPSRVGFMTGSGGYIKVRYDATGTTSAASVSANVVMASAAIRQSGG